MKLAQMVKTFLLITILFGIAHADKKEWIDEFCTELNQLKEYDGLLQYQCDLKSLSLKDAYALVSQQINDPHIKLEALMPTNNKEHSFEWMNDYNSIEDAIVSYEWVSNSVFKLTVEKNQGNETDTYTFKLNNSNVKLFIDFETMY